MTYNGANSVSEEQRTVALQGKTLKRGDTITISLNEGQGGGGSGSSSGGGGGDSDKTVSIEYEDDRGNLILVVKESSTGGVQGSLAAWASGNKLVFLVIEDNSVILEGDLNNFAEAYMKKYPSSLKITAGAVTLKLTKVSNSSSTTPSDDQIAFTDVNTGDVYYTTITSEGNGRLTIKGKVYELTYSGANSIPEEQRTVAIQGKILRKGDTITITIGSIDGQGG